MVITKIDEYTPGKYKIFLNDEFAFVLYKGDIRHMGLEEDSVLSDEAYDKIMNEILDKRAKMRAMHLLEKQDRTEANLRQKLNENLYPEEIIDSAIAYMKKFKYIDDARYAENYILYRKDSMSRGELSKKLVQKGVDKEVIDNVYDDLCGDNSEGEKEIIRSQMIKKCPNLSELDHKEKNKLFAYFYRKGFSVRQVECVYKELAECIS